MNAPVIHPNPAMYLSPEMIREIALGMDAPDEVAARHGFSHAEFMRLQNQEWFGRMVVESRMELDRDGHTNVAKGKMMLWETYQRLYQMSLAGQLSAQLSLELTKQLADVTGEKSRQAVDQGSRGPAFAININLNAGEALPPGPRPVEGQAKVIEPVTISIPKDDLPARPEGMRVPDFKMTRDLVGTPVAVAAAQGARV